MQPALDFSALTIVMALVPGILSRNKNFALYTDPSVRRARSRARELRDVAKQIALPSAEAIELHPISDAEFDLSYSVPEIRLGRRVRVSSEEAACLSCLVARAGKSERLLVPLASETVERVIGRLSPTLGNFAGRS